VREADTGVELKFGQTLAIAGLLSQEIEHERRGIPGLMDVPYLGVLFRRTHDQVNEIELLILVRPELVEGLDPDQVPPCGPGMNSLSPCDCDLYWKGHNEVPIRLPDPMGPSGPPVMMGPSGPNGVPSLEQLPPPQSAPASPPAAPSADDKGAVKAAGPSKGDAIVSDVPQNPRLVASRARAPASSQRAPVDDSSNPSNPQRPTARPQSNAASGPPGFIGPIGYDVRN